MKRKRIKKVAIILSLVMLMDMFDSVTFVAIHTEAAQGQMEDRRFQRTRYGVKDDRVIAHKLILNDNEEIIDTGDSSLILVKEVMDSTRIRLHVYGVRGLIHTYDLKADNEIVKEWEAADFGTVNDSRKFATQLTQYYGGHDGRATSDHLSKLYKVLNPSTGKLDLINIENSKYYTYGADRISMEVLSDPVNNDSMDEIKNTDQIRWVVYGIGTKEGIADITGKKITEAEYDNVRSKNKALILSKEIHDNGTIEHETTALTMDGKLIKLNNSQPMEGPYYAHYTDDNQYSYINIETGKRIELGTYSDHGILSYGRSFILKSKELDDYVGKDAWTYNQVYMMTTDGKVINLNDKLGVDIVSDGGTGGSHHELGGDCDCVYVEGYRVLKRVNGEAITEYAFRGFVDANGNIVYGYDTNEPLEWYPYWWSGDYGILKRNKIPADTKYDYKVIDRQGREIYQFTSGNITAKNLNNQYLSFNESKGVVTLDLKNKRLLSNVKLKFDGSSYDFQKYTWTTEKGDFIMVQDDNGHLGIMNGKNQKIHWLKKDENGNTDAFPEIYVYEDQKEKGKKNTIITIYADNEQIALNADMEPVKGIPPLKSDKYYDHVYGNYFFHHTGKVYDFNGNLIIENVYVSNPYRWRGNSEGRDIVDMVPISKTENGSKYKFDQEASHEWNYFDIENEKILLDQYYECASDYYYGLACVYENNNEISIINKKGEVIVQLNTEETEYGRWWWDYGFKGIPADVLSSRGVILNDCFYDFSKITSDDIVSQEDIKNCYDNDSDYRAEYVEESDKNFRFNGLDCDFTLPDEIPVIGGGKVKIDFSKLPISVQRSGNVVRVGFGILQSENEESQNLFQRQTWDTLKKSVEKVKKNASKGFGILGEAKDWGCIEMPMSKKVKTNVVGYVEGTLQNGKLEQNATGRFVCEISASVNKQWQTVIVSVPVVFSASGEVKGKEDFAVGLDWKNAKVTLEGEQSVEFTLPTVKLSAGVGIAYVANISVYGQLENILEAKTSQDLADKDDMRIRDYIDGEMGVSASLLLASYDKTLIKAKRKMIYDSKKGVITSNMSNKMAIPDEKDYKIQRNYVSDMTDWQNDNSESSGETADIQILQQNIYRDAKPQVVTTDDGKKIMTFITDVPKRITGNHTAVAYSVYNEKTNLWSEPKLVSDDGTADMYPKLATDGKRVYLAWVDTNRDDFIESTSVSEMAKSCEISVAEFDIENECFKNITRLTNDEYADINPSLLVKEGKAYVSWITNENNDVVRLSGHNTVMCATNSEGEWKHNLYKTLDTPITDTQIGVYQDDVMIAYITDSDKNMVTIDDTKVFVGNFSGAVEEVFKDKAGIQSVQFMKIGGKNVLAFSAKDGFYFTENNSAYMCLFDHDVQSNIKYSCISGDNADLLLCSEAGGNGTNIYGYLYKDGKLSKKIPITDQDVYIKEPNGFYKNGEFFVVFTRSKADINDTGISSSTDICAMHFKEYQDLKIDNLYVDEETVVPNQKGLAQLSVTNQGVKEQKGFTIHVMAGNEKLGSYLCSETLPAGETKNINVTFDVPQDFLQGTKISCVIEGEDDNSKNNILNETVGKTNLALDVFEKENDYNETECIVYIKNTSGYKADAVMRICKSNKNGILLQEKSLGTIQPGEIQRIQYSSEEINDLSQDDSSLYFDVSCSDEEQFESDNYGYLLIEEKNDDATPTPSDIVPIVSSVPTESEAPSPGESEAPIPGESKAPSSTASAIPTESASAIPSVQPTIKVDYYMEGSFTGWGGEEAYPSSKGHAQDSGDPNFYYADRTNIVVGKGYNCGLELMNPYNDLFTGAENEMSAFIQNMKTPAIRVTLENGGTASAWNWHTELSIPSGEEVILTKEYLDSGYFALFGNDDTITKVEFYDKGEISEPSLSPSVEPTTKPTAKPTAEPAEKPTQEPTASAPSSVDTEPPATQTPAPEKSGSPNETPMPTASAAPTKPVYRVNVDGDEYAPSKPAKVKIKKASPQKSGKVKLTWKKVSRTYVYKVQYSTKRSFRGAKVREAYGTKINLRLKKNKTYYIRVRSCKYGNSANNFRMVKGNWSKVKKVKTKA